MKTILDLQYERRHPELEGVRRFAEPVWLCGGSGKTVRVHMAGLGDVGMNAALALTLLGGSLISELGLYDLNGKQCMRMETELGQIGAADPERAFPAVRRISEDELFDCEVFLFCATRSVPAVGSSVQDVRMAQYGANRPIVEGYAQRAAREGYRGLFVVVSDPVDLLTMAAFRAAQNEGAPMAANQFQGFGLGVMYARAKYFAKEDPALSAFGTEGRVFGPHGKDLVAANSLDPSRYDDDRSRALTKKTVEANLAVRELGYKPYIAPACSSAAITLLAVLSGGWNDSAVYLGGLYFGCRNRLTKDGIKIEAEPLPDRLYERLKGTYARLEDAIWNT